MLKVGRLFTVATVLGSCLCVSPGLGGSTTANPTATAPAPDSPTDGPLPGTGDGRIHILPSLNRPSVKNGETLILSAVVTSQAPIASVNADLGGVTRLTLTPKSKVLSSALPSGAHAAIYEARWVASGLEEKVYPITLEVKDQSGHTLTDRTLQFSDPAAGISTPGTTAYPDAGMRHLETLHPEGETRIRTAVLDPVRGHAYFGTFSQPARIVKVALATGGTTPTRVGSLILDRGENYAIASTIDPAGGYAYFGTQTSPGRVIKVALTDGNQPPRRVGAITLGTGEDFPASLAFDSVRNHIYVGTQTTPGQIVKLSRGTGDALPQRLSSLTLGTTEGPIRSIVLDTAAGFLYTASTINPGPGTSIVKATLTAGSSAPSRASSLSLPTINSLTGAAIDPANGHAYFAGSERLVKLAVGAGSTSPTLLHTVTINPPNGAIDAIVFDSAQGLIHAVGNANPTLYHRFQKGAGDNSPTLINTLPLASVESEATCLVLDEANRKIYTGTGAPLVSAKVVQLDAPPSNFTPTRLNALTLNGNEAQMTAGAMDEVGGYQYFATNDNIGASQIYKVRLDRGDGIPQIVGYSSLGANEISPSGMALDPTRGYGYISINGSPGRIVKFRLGSGDQLPQRIGSLTLDTNENNPRTPYIDGDSGYGYISTGTSPGRIVKFALGDGDALPTRLGALVLNTGDNFPTAPVPDPVRGMIYYGLNTSPARIIKVDPGVDDNLPTLVSGISLSTGEDFASFGIGDPAAGYAWFRMGTSPTRLVKVAMTDGTAPPTRIGAMTFDAADGNIQGGTLDPAAGFSYWVSGSSPSRIVKVALGAGFNPPSRIGHVQLQSPDEFSRLIFLDRARGMALIAAAINAGSQWIPYATVSQKGLVKGTQINLPEPGALEDVRLYSHRAEGQLRLAIYDQSNPKNLLWQSGPVANTVQDGFVTVPITSGSPGSLTLPAGTYYLAWQTDSARDILSYTTGTQNSGFLLPRAFGPMPAGIPSTSITLTSENWAQFVTYANDTAGAPTVAQVTAINPRSVEVQFSEPLLSPAANLVSNYTLSGEGRASLTPNPDTIVQTGANSYTLNWNSGSTLPGGVITVTVTGVTDLGGVPIGNPNSGTATVPPVQWSSAQNNTFPSSAGWTILGQSGPLFTNDIGNRSYDAANTALVATVGASPRARIIGWLEDSASDLPYSAVGSANFVRAKFSMVYSGPGDSANESLANRVPNFRLSLRTRGVVTTQLEINHNAQTGGSPSQLTFTRELGPSKNPAAPSIYRVDFDPVDVPYLNSSTTEGIQRGFETLVSGADYSFVTGNLSLTDSSIGTYPALDPTVAPVKTFATGGPAGASDFDNSNVVLATLGLSINQLARYLTGPASDYFNPAVLTIAIPENSITIARAPSGIAVNSTIQPTNRMGVADAALVGGVFGDTPATRLRIEAGRLYDLRFRLNHAAASDTTPYTRLNVRSAGFGYNATLELLGGRGLAAADSRTFLSQVMPGTGTQVPGTTTDGTTYRLLFNSPLNPDIRNDVAGTLAQKFPQLSTLPGPGVATPGATPRDLNLGFTILDSLSLISSTESDPAEAANNLTLNRIEIRNYPQVAD